MFGLLLDLCCFVVSAVLACCWFNADLLSVCCWFGVGLFLVFWRGVVVVCFGLSVCYWCVDGPSLFVLFVLSISCRFVAGLFLYLVSSLLVCCLSVWGLVFVC